LGGFGSQSELVDWVELELRLQPRRALWVRNLFCLLCGGLHHLHRRGFRLSGRLDADHLAEHKSRSVRAYKAREDSRGQDKHHLVPEARHSHRADAECLKPCAGSIARLAHFEARRGDVVVGSHRSLCRARAEHGHVDAKRDELGVERFSERYDIGLGRSVDLNFKK